MLTTVYKCDRCGKENNNPFFSKWTRVIQFRGYSEKHLCPDCSKRALERPRDYFHCSKCGEPFSSGFGGVVAYGEELAHFPSCP